MPDDDIQEVAVTNVAVEPTAETKETAPNAAPGATDKDCSVEKAPSDEAVANPFANAAATDPPPAAVGPVKNDEVIEHIEAAAAVDADTAVNEVASATVPTGSAESEYEASAQNDPASDPAADRPIAGPDPTKAQLIEDGATDESIDKGQAVVPSTVSDEQNDEPNRGVLEDLAPEPSAEVPTAVGDPVADEPAADDSAAPAADSATAEPETLTLAQVDSFESFLRLLLEADGALKPFELPSGSGSRAALVSPVNLEPFEDMIRTIAEADSKLASTLALLITADRSALTGAPRRNVTDLAARLLNRHPAFASDEVVEQRLAVLVAGEAELETVARLITRLRNLLERPFGGKDDLKTPAARQSLQDNAVHVAVLIAASAAKWDVGTCIDALADNAWDAGAGFADIVAQREKLVALPKSTRKAAGLIVEVGRDRLRSVVQERDSALIRVERSRAEAQQLSEQLDAQRRRTAELEAELESVRAEHQAEVAARRSERMGSTTDFETLRVDLTRTISKQVESLEDALDALEHGQSQITKEFVGRSVNTLRVSLSSLQPRTAHDSQGETA